jgi:hypothetical protein
MDTSRRTLSRRDLLKLAIYQKIILLCVPGFSAAVVLLVVDPHWIPRWSLPYLYIFRHYALPSLWLLCTVFASLLAAKLDGPDGGVLLGLLMQIPVIGFFPLLIDNGRASEVLRAHGYRVGLLGADLSSEPDR